MLRASGQHDSNDYTLSGVTGDTPATGVAAGEILLAFANAALGRNPAILQTARQAVIQSVGTVGLIDAAAVIGGFDGITRIADATGIPLEPAKAAEAADFIENLGLGKYRAEKV